MNIKEFFDRQNWTFAKTYAQNAPHEYIIKGRQVGTDDEFVEAARFINRYGITAYFYNQPNCYLIDDDYMYWTKFNDADNAKVINRCHRSLYDFVLRKK